MVCKVRSVREDATGVNRVAIQLPTAAPEFWGVTFPPDDRDTSKRVPARSAPKKLSSS
jgi:hypothetical protein